jgi:succinate dehydrogenase / fumarate reductase flavoprotein subunit
MDANWRNTLLVCKATEAATAEAMVPRVTVEPEPQVPMRPDLLEVFELSELEKYYTDSELTEHPERKG